MSKRIEWVDFGKGVTILLVVFGHVVLGLLQADRFLNGQNKLLLLFVELVYVFHMPVFFALSGFFFKTYENWSNFLKGTKQKLIALGIPYLLFSIIMFIMKKLGEGSVRKKTSISALLNIYKEPIEHTWFLYALFGVFVYAGVVSIFVKSKKMMLAISFLGYFVVNVVPVDVYIVQRTLVWFPFFTLGFILRDKKINKNVILPLVLSYVIYIVVWMKFNFETRISYSEPKIWGIILLISVLLAFSIIPRIKSNGKIYRYFCKYGEISLPIYLIHAPVVSVTRIVLFKIGISNLIIHIVLGLFLGWFLTIILFRIASKIKVVNFIFYPTKYIK